MSTATIHVEPDRLGSWLVLRDAERLSEHETATDAERAAFVAARRLECPSVLMHDRYLRVHELSVRR